MRETGYYYVRMDSTEPWEIAHWDAGFWWIIGSTSHYNEKVFSIIGNKVTMPE